MDYPRKVAPRMLQFRGFYILYNSKYVMCFMVSKGVNTEAFGGVFGHLTRVCLETLVIWETDGCLRYSLRVAWKCISVSISD